MIDKTIIKRIKLWIKDFKEINPKLNAIDYTTFEGSAYLIFKNIIRIKNE